MIVAKARRLSQRERRVLVLAEYAAIFSYPVVAILRGSAWWLLIAVVGIVATVLIHERLLLPSTQKIANKADADLDERQTAVRDDAHRTAYQVLGSVILVALVLLQMLTTGPLSDRPWTPQISVRELVSSVTPTAIWLYVSLPTAVIAWAEPDPDPDELL